MSGDVGTAITVAIAAVGADQGKVEAWLAKLGHTIDQGLTAQVVARLAASVPSPSTAQVPTGGPPPPPPSTMPGSSGGPLPPVTPQAPSDKPAPTGGPPVPPIGGPPASGVVPSQTSIPPPLIPGGPPPMPSLGALKPSTTGGVTGPKRGTGRTVVKKLNKEADQPAIPVALPGGVDFATLSNGAVRKQLRAECMADDVKRAEWIQACQESTTDLKTREMLFEIAYNTTIGSVARHVDYQPEKRNRYFQELSKLLADFPKDKLPKTWSVEEVTGKGHAGEGEHGEINMRYGEEDIPDFSRKYDGPNTDPGQVLSTVQAFEALIKHEIGHSLQDAVGYESLVSSPAGGGWNIMDGLEPALTAEFATDLSDFCKAVTTALGTNAVGLIQSAEVAKALGQVGSADAAGLAAALATMPAIKPGTDAKMIEAAIPSGHPLLRAVEQAVAGFSALGNTPVNCAGRVLLQWGSMEKWVTFDAEGYKKRVSNYQYNSPSEWFAEFYTTVNNAAPNVRDGGKAAFPNAYQWLKEKNLIYYSP